MSITNNYKILGGIKLEINEVGEEDDPNSGVTYRKPRPLNFKFMSCVLSGLWYSQLMAKFLLLPILFMALTAVYFYRFKEVNSFIYIHRKPITVIGLAGLVGLVLVYILFGINISIFSA